MQRPSRQPTRIAENPITTRLCHIGTSGWNYRHWANGRFYPEGLKPGAWLPFLADHFDTVEVNYSFYRIPSVTAVTSWQASTPAEFLFAFKLWRGITQFRKLVDAGEFLDRFLESVNVIQSSRRGPLLVQLPPQLRINLQRLDAFLTELHHRTRESPWPVAVEFRHPSWLTKPVYRLLDRYGAAITLADQRRCPITEPNDAPFIYIRRHGGWHHGEGRYLRDEISADANRIRGWLGDGKTIFVYYNNDRQGHAVDNAQELRALIDL